MAIKDPNLQEQSQLVRCVAAMLKMPVPTKEEIRIRGCALRKAQSELGTLKGGFITRLLEYTCDADYPDEDVRTFRIHCMRAAAKHLTLSEYKAPADAG